MNPEAVTVRIGAGKAGNNGWLELRVLSRALWVTDTAPSGGVGAGGHAGAGAGDDGDAGDDSRGTGPVRHPPACRCNPRRPF